MKPKNQKYEEAVRRNLQNAQTDYGSITALSITFHSHVGVMPKSKIRQRFSIRKDDDRFDGQLAELVSRAGFMAIWEDRDE